MRIHSSNSFDDAPFIKNEWPFSDSELLSPEDQALEEMLTRAFSSPIEKEG